MDIEIRIIFSVVAALISVFSLYTRLFWFLIHRPIVSAEIVAT